jgi:hypothetical protein
VIADGAGNGVQRIIGKYSLDGFDPICRQSGVGVDPADDIAASGIETAVAGMDYTLTFGSDYPDERELRRDLGGGIGGIIIDDDDFAGSDALTGDRLKTETDTLGFVIYWYH